jgi:inorganic triphosphatase YgiF
VDVIADKIKLRLAVAPERAAEVRQLALLHRLAEKRGTSRQLSTIYLDTPEQALAKRGIALCIRRVGRRHIQTINLLALGRGLADSSRVRDSG